MLSIMGKNKFWSLCTKYAEDEMYRVQNENERTTDICHKWVVNSASEFRKESGRAAKYTYLDNSVCAKFKTHRTARWYLALGPGEG